MVVIPERVRERYLASLTIEGNSPCWVSTYSTGSHGYTQIGWHDGDDRHMALGHRVAWIIYHGFIPDGMTVDHLCRNRRCGRIDHLRLLTNKENASLNGNAIKTHCKRGDQFDEENTYVDPKGHRRCRACAR